MAVIALMCSNNLDEKFYDLMEMYNQKQVSKSMVDNVQWALQCCGAYGYMDWFKVDWCESNIENMKSNRK